MMQAQYAPFQSASGSNGEGHLNPYAPFQLASGSRGEGHLTLTGPPSLETITAALEVLNAMESQVARSIISIRFDGYPLTDGALADLHCEFPCCLTLSACSTNVLDIASWPFAMFPAVLWLDASDTWVDARDLPARLRKDRDALRFVRTMTFCKTSVTEPVVNDLRAVRPGVLVFTR